MLSIITKLIIGLAGLSYWHLRFDLDKSGYSLGCGGSVAHSRQKQVPRCDGHDKTTGLNHRPFQVDNSSKVAFSAVVVWLDCPTGICDSIWTNLVIRLVVVEVSPIQGRNKFGGERGTIRPRGEISARSR